MNSDVRDNAPTTDTTSPSALPKSEPRDDSGRPRDSSAEKLGEAEFLARQAELAKEAMAHAWLDFSRGIAQGADPREWTRDYPLIALTAAAGAGFVAAVRLIPSKEEQALKKLAALERALHPPQPVVAPVSADGATDATYKKSIWSTVFGDLIRAMGPALSSAITAAVTAKAAEPDNSGNGHGPEASYADPAQADPNAP